MRIQTSAKLEHISTRFSEDMMEMSIQEYTVKDYEGVIRLWISCGLIKNDSQATREEISAFLSRGIFLVSKGDADRVIGSVMGGWDGWRGWIYKLAVAGEERRKGIATRLLTEIAGRLHASGATIIRAYVENQNGASLSLFRKMGYTGMDGFLIVTQGRQ